MKELLLMNTTGGVTDLSKVLFELPWLVLKYVNKHLLQLKVRCKMCELLQRRQTISGECYKQPLINLNEELEHKLREYPKDTRRFLFNKQCLIKWCRTSQENSTSTSLEWVVPLTAFTRYYSFRLHFALLREKRLFWWAVRFLCRNQKLDWWLDCFKTIRLLPLQNSFVA